MHLLNSHLKNWIADLFAATYFSVIKKSLNFGKKVYEQVVGIPMSAIFTPLLEPCSGIIMNHTLLPILVKIF